jgi:hypothetical protein
MAWHTPRLRCHERAKSRSLLAQNSTPLMNRVAMVPKNVSAEKNSVTGYDRDMFFCSGRGIVIAVSRKAGLGWCSVGWFCSNSEG